MHYVFVKSYNMARLDISNVVKEELMETPNSLQCKILKRLFLE